VDIRDYKQLGFDEVEVVFLLLHSLPNLDDRPLKFCGRVEQLIVRTVFLFACDDIEINSEESGIIIDESFAVLP
jgi:hypothetical protein